MNTPLGIPGQAAAQTRLLNYLSGGRLHPAVILSGEDRTLRWTLAKNIAKFFLCSEKGSAKAPFCDQCHHCRRIEKEVHPDVLLCRDTEEESIKIDTVRDICHQMEVGPLEQRYKICLIDDCHRMNSAAANALLKTLEEPGEGRFFWLLTSQPGSLLPTILSRCLKFRLLPTPSESHGKPEWNALLAEFQKSHDPYAVSAKLDSKEKVQSFVASLMTDLRHEVVAASAAPPLSESALEQLQRFDAAVELEGRLRSNANYGLMLENFLSRNF